MEWTSCRRGVDLVSSQMFYVGMVITSRRSGFRPGGKEASSVGRSFNDRELTRVKKIHRQVVTSY